MGGSKYVTIPMYLLKIANFSLDQVIALAHQVVHYLSPFICLPLLAQKVRDHIASQLLTLFAILRVFVAGCFGPSDCFPPPFKTVFYAGEL